MQCCITCFFVLSCLIAVQVRPTASAACRPSYQLGFFITISFTLTHCVKENQTVKRHHDDQHELILGIVSHIAYDRNKSTDKILRLLLVKQNKKIMRQFWEILDQMLPNHGYTYFGCCGECGQFELL